MSYLLTTPSLLDLGFADAHMLTDPSAFSLPLSVIGRIRLFALHSYHHNQNDNQNSVGNEAFEGTTTFVDLLRQALAETVDERKQRIFALRYGWSELPPQSFPSIGKLLERHSASITRLHDTTVRKLWIAGMRQLAGREPEGACTRLQQLLQSTISPKEKGAHARVVQFAATHLPSLPQKRVAQPLMYQLMLMSPTRNDAPSDTKSQANDMASKEGNVL